MDNSFHGRTFGALAATGTEKYRAPFEPLMPGVQFVKFNDVADLEKHFDSSVCAILIEAVQGEGGIFPVSKEFFSRARTLSDQHGAVLIADEIQSGLGRTGQWFAYQHHRITPDVVTLAKPIASGLPLGALLAREHLAGAFKPGLHGTTFGGGPLACAVAVTVLDTLQKDKLLANVRSVGRYFQHQLEELKTKHDSIREVRGLGLMLAAQLSFPGKDVVDACLERGLVINCTHDTTLRLLPAFILTERQVDSAMKVLHEALVVAEKKQAAPKPAAQAATKS